MKLLIKLFIEFFKIGLFTFGGGYAMIPLVMQVSIANNWIESEDLFYNLLGICESTPGPIAINMATYIGSVNGGILGALASTIGVILPSFIIILLIAIGFTKLTSNKYVKMVIQGINCIVIALILKTGITMLYNLFLIDNNSINYLSIIILSLITLLYFLLKKFFKYKLSAINIIIISAILGLVINIII